MMPKHHYECFRIAREDKKMTQAQIAKILGISRPQYQLYESGKREIPFHLAIVFAEELGCSLDYLAGLTAEPLPF